jgi:hypothetical protein
MKGPNELAFERMIRIAEVLPWSSREAIYAGLSRIILEQIMSTSVSSALLSIESDEEVGRKLKILVKSSLRGAMETAEVKLTHSDDLVDIYVDAFDKEHSRTRISSTGDKCNWVMGCPGVESATFRGTRFEPFTRLDDDHIFPTSRTGRFAEAGLGQKLCRYHNIFWKGQHIAFALDDFWLL